MSNMRVLGFGCCDRIEIPNIIIPLLLAEAKSNEVFFRISDEDECFYCAIEDGSPWTPIYTSSTSKNTVANLVSKGEISWENAPQYLFDSLFLRLLITEAYHKQGGRYVVSTETI